MIDDPNMPGGSQRLPHTDNGAGARASHGPSQELTLEDLLLVLRRHWKGAMLVGVLVVLAGGALLSLSSPAFTSSTAVLFERNRPAGGMESLGAMLPGMGGGSGMESQKDVLRSFSLATQVLEDLGLNAELEGPEHLLPARPTFWQWRLSGRAVEPFARGLVVRDVDSQTLLADREYELQFVDRVRYQVRRPGGQEPLAQAAIGEPVAVDGVGWTLQWLGGAEPEAGATFALTIEPTQQLAENFREQLLLEGGMRARGEVSDVLRISYTAGSPYLAKEVVSRLSELFMDKRHEWATSVPRAMQTFVTEQLDDLRDDLDRSAMRLAEHQRETGMLRLEPQLQADLERLVEAEGRLRQAEVRMAQLSKLREGLQDNETLEPTLFAHLDDPVLQQQAEQLSELNQQIDALRSQFRDNYPPLRQREARRESLLQDLRATVDRYYQRNEENYAELGKVVEEYQQKFAALPESARSLAEVTRSAKLYEELYLFLLREQQKARIAEASTLSSVRPVDQAVLPLRESSPGARRMAVVILALASLFSGGYLFWQGLRMREFVSSDQVRHATAFPVYALVPFGGRKARRASPQVLVNDQHHPMLEAMRQLRANLINSRAGKTHQTVLVSSSRNGEGKTTIASNLACILARSRSAQVQRVILIDVDMFRPSLHTVFERPASPGLSDYLNGEATIEEIIQTVELPGGSTLELICAGPVPPAPVELQETQLMRDLLDHVRNHYSFGVLDGPPYPQVTSSLLLAEHVDRLLSICTLGQTDRRAFLHHVNDLGQVNRHLGLVINSTERTLGEAYGYGYGYAGGNGANGDAGVLRRLWRKVHA